MIAVIMAGGKGTRMAGSFKDIPKPMIPIGGMPVLQHQILNLKASGITDFLLVVGHLKDAIVDYFRDGRDLGVNIRYFEETEPLGTGGALWRVKDQLDGDFILAFGDILLDVDWERFARWHHAKEALVTLFAHPNAHPYDSDLIIHDDADRVVGWLGKKADRSGIFYHNMVNAGLYLVSSRIFERFAHSGKTDFEADVILPLIHGNEPVYCYRSTEYVKDMGTPDRLGMTSRDLESGLVSRRNLRNPQKCIFLDRDGTINRLQGFIRSHTQFELEESVATAIKAINDSGYLCIVVTNQPVLARGEATVRDLDEIHAKMETLLGMQGCYIDGLYYCPHHPDRGFAGEVPELKVDCDCRKPRTGMLERAAADYHIDLANSWLIGDSTADIQTGASAGLRTVLLRTGEQGKDGKFSAQPLRTCDKMIDAVNFILSEDAERGI